MGYRVRRQHELRRRRDRRLKIGELRAKLAVTTSKAEREKILEKMRKISPLAAGFTR